MKTKASKFSPAIIAVLLVIVSAVIVIACVFSRPQQSALSLSVEAVTLPVSSSKSLQISCSMEDAQYSYEVYDEEIAKIEDGVVYGLSVGTTSVRITATCNDERAVSTAQITVTENPNDPVVDLPQQITLYLIDKNQDDAAANGCNSELAFYSYKNFQATVSGDAVKIKNNVISANKEGEAQITFRGVNDGSQQIVNVTVKSVPVEIENLPNSLTLSLSQQTQIDFALEPSYYTGQANIEFVSSSGILQIEGNTITATSAGSAVVEVMLNDSKVAQIEVLVEAPFTCALKAVANCQVEDDTVLLSPDEVGTFTIQLLSPSGEPINFSAIEIVTNGVELKRDMNYFHVSTISGGTITIYAPDLGGKIIISVAIS